MQQLAAFLSSLSLGSSRSVAGLTVFPLLRQPAPEPWYDTLTEAVGAHMARVTEVSDAGRVPELQEIRTQVEEDWQRDRMHALRAQSLKSLAAQYTIQRQDIDANTAK